MSSHILPAGAGGCCCFSIISTSEVGVVERFGKFDRFAEVRKCSTHTIDIYIFFFNFDIYFMFNDRLAVLHLCAQLKFLLEKFL